MKAPGRNIEIEYWTFPDGKDFKNFDDFVDEIDKDYFLTVSKIRTDALGGGLYDLIITITENLSLSELASSYVEDGVKAYIDYIVVRTLLSTKKLFQKNPDLKPSIDKITLEYKDCKVTLYEVYENGIEESFEQVMINLFQLAHKHKKKFKKIKKIHIPIFKHRDTYDLCDYRVKLDVDENISEFSKSDYFKFWGLSFKNNKRVYDVKKEKILKERFYTQSGYDKLYRTKRM